MKSKRDVALMYAAHGWRVLRGPTRMRNGKKPGPIDKGWQERATTNEHAIRDLWDKDYNIGIATGQKSGVVVVDIDIDADPEFVESLGLPLDTRWCETPSSGQHCYLAPPHGRELRNTQTDDVFGGVGVHFRGDGGFVWAPPTEFEGYGRYRRLAGPRWRLAPMPENILWALTEGRSKRAKEVSRVVDDVELPVAHAEGKERHNLLVRHIRRWARYKMPEEEMTICAMSINVACCHPPKPEDEVRAIVKWAIGLEANSSEDAIVVSLDSIKEEKISWLWHGRFPRGAMVIVDGDPDQGKSTMLYDLIARITSGGAFPDNTLVGEPQKVLVMTAEDSLKNRVRPILRIAGANLKNVLSHALPRDSNGQVVPFAIPDNIRELEATLRKVRPALVLIDPIMGFTGEKINTGVDASIRKMTGPLADVADRHNCCIVCVRHFKKDPSEKNPVYKGGGSIALIGQARVGMMVGPSPIEDEDDHVQVLAITKGNLVQHGSVPSLAYRLVPSEEDESVPSIVWQGFTPVTAEDILGADARKKAPARDQALEFMDMFLSEQHSGVLMREFSRACRESGITPKTQRNAFDKSGHHKWAARSGGKILGWKVHHRGLKVAGCAQCAGMYKVEKVES